MAGKEKPSERFIEGLPPEVREGLWTFPKIGADSDELLLDAVLALLSFAKVM